MNERTYKIALACVVAGFTVAFSVLVIPALIKDPDFFGAFAAGFVNPYSSGYSIDVILCWVVLAIWVAYEAKALSVKHGWICLLLGVMPGVAVGFPLYLILRANQIKENGNGS